MATEEQKKSDQGFWFMAGRLSKQLVLNLVCFLVALCMTSRGVCFLDLVQLYNASLETLAPSLIASSIGTVLGSNLMGLLMRSWPSLSCFFESAGLFLSGVSVALFPLGKSPLFLHVVSFTAGIGLAMARSGATAICLKMWRNSSLPKAPFLHSLLLFQSAGNALVPIIAKPFLTPHFDNDTNIHNNNGIPNNDTFDNSNNLDNNGNVDNNGINEAALMTNNVSGGVEILLMRPQHLSGVSLLFPLIGFFGLSLALIFLVIGFLQFKRKAPKEQLDSYQSPTETNKNEDGIKKNKWRVYVLLALSSLFYVLDFGMQMGISNFLIASVLQGQLHLTKAQGTDLQALYFSAQFLSRILSICLAFRLRPGHFIIIGLATGFASALTICLVYQSSHLALKVGYAALGLAMGSMSANTTMWLEQYIKVTASVSGLLLTASATGNLVSTLLFAPLIENQPGILMFYQLVAIVVHMFIFGLGTIIGKNIRKDRRNDFFDKRYREQIFEDDNVCQLIAFTRF